MNAVTLLLPEMVLRTAGTAGRRLDGHGVAVQGTAIVDVAPHAVLRQRFPVSDVIDLPGQLLMPGLINAHQHGRGIGTVQLGVLDDHLELFMVRSRLRRRLDPGLNAKLACTAFLSTGVTGVLQANTPLGSGDYEAELRATLDAYDRSGIRAAVAVGCMDRGHVVYPDEGLAELRTELDEDLRQFAMPSARPVYAGDAEVTVAMTDRLLASYGGHPRITIGSGPAGPQWVSDDMLRRVGEHAAAHDLFVHFHGLESIAQVAAVARLYPEGMLERLRRLGLANERTSIGHAVWMTATDVRLAAEHGVGFVRNASSNLRLHNGVAPFAEYAHAGVPLAIGTDNFALGDREDLFAEMRLAGALARPSIHETVPAPDAETLLQFATLGGARMCGFDSVGDVRIGWQADLIALSLAELRGPFVSERIPVADLIVQRAHGDHVTLTMVGGRILYRDGRLQTLDAASLKADAANAWTPSGMTEADAERVERFCSQVAAFYRARAQPARLPPHWRPLALKSAGWGAGSDAAG